jgi:hypothetical protein
MTKIPRTFGPAVVHEKDGTFRPVCTYCFLRVGQHCTEKQGESQEIPDTENTPEWCKYREPMLADAKEAAH